jgi:hypothetical protein
MPPTGGKTPAWAFPTMVFTNAPYPQETFEYLMWMMGPLNDRMIRSSMEGRGMACYKRAYDEILPTISGMGWIKTLFDFVQDATPMSSTTFWTLMQDKILAKEEEYLLDKIPSAESAMEQAVKEVEEELAKQKT